MVGDVSATTDCDATAAVSAGEWLGLGEAARLLGIHYTTLRRWANAGEVACFRTPGGQRRFAPADLERFRAGLRRPAGAEASGAAVSVTPLQEQTVRFARWQMEQQGASRQGWVAGFDPGQRQRFRGYGRQFVGLLLRYGAGGPPDDAYLEEARAIATDHGCTCRRAGLSIGDTLAAVLFFRRSLMEMLVEAGTGIALRRDGRGCERRVCDFMDAILLAAAEGYARADDGAAGVVAPG
jgi:excisionase family DNA binding protein